jgi:hypothetical protein
VINHVSGGMVSTYAGSTSVSAAGAGFQDGDLPSYVGATSGSIALFNNPGGIKFDSFGNLFVADLANNAIRKIVIAASQAAVTTIAGGGVGYIGPSYRGATNGAGMAASFNQPLDIVVSPLNPQILYVSDNMNNLIRKIDMAHGNMVSTFAGGGGGTATGSRDGLGTAALFNLPTGMVSDSAGYLFVGDAGNQKIRRIAPDQTVETLVIDDIGVLDFTPNFLEIDSAHNLYVSTVKNQIIKLTPVP